MLKQVPFLPNYIEEMNMKDWRMPEGGYASI